MGYYYCTKCGYQHQSVSVIGKEHWEYRSKPREEVKEMEEESGLEPLFSISVNVNKRLLRQDLLELILAYALPMDEDEED